MQSPVVPNEIIVRFRPQVDRTTATRTVAALGARTIARGVGGFAVVRAGDAPVTELIAQLAASPEVAYVERNLARLPAAVPNDPMFTQQWGLSNTAQQHPISGSPSVTRAGVADADIDAPEAWDTEQGDPETVVAIIDSGTDVAHPDLAPNIWVNPGEIPGNGLDDDGNGFPDDVNGWDFARESDQLLQPEGAYPGWDHGTHVAGIIGAAANDATGVAGVCPSCRLMVLKVFKPGDTDRDGIRDTMVADVGSVLEALDYAIEMGADVVNGSFGGSIIASRAERTMIKRGIAAGITMVFASGNEDGDNDLLATVDFDGDGVIDIASPSYPASYDLTGIISVAASNDSDQYGSSSGCVSQQGSPRWPCFFTNWGRYSVDLAAPGVDVVSTLPNNSYDFFDGTSMAAPHVAGVAALVKSRHPGYRPAQVKAAILNSVDLPSSLHEIFPFPDRGGVTGDFTVTSGRVNAAAALDASTVSRHGRTDGSIRGARRLEERVTGAVRWPEDVNDVFKKRLRAGARYEVVLNTAGRADLDLQLYKPGTNDIWQLDEACINRGRCKLFGPDPTESGDVTATFTAGVTGTYYFHVNAWILNAGSYTLRIARL
jgi:subtilisin family serine protease